MDIKQYPKKHQTQKEKPQHEKKNLGEKKNRTLQEIKDGGNSPINSGFLY